MSVAAICDGELIKMQGVGLGVLFKMQLLLMFV